MATRICIIPPDLPTHLPAFDLDKEFLGPAMLAKAYRFLLDPRDSREEEILASVDEQKGVWGCKTVFNCVKVCPKQVPPTHAIVRMRRKLLRQHLLTLFGRLASLIF